MSCPSITVLLSVLFTALVATGLSGCGLLPSDGPAEVATAPPGRPAAAFVVGRHGGAADPALTPLSGPVVDDVVAGQGYLALVAADGVPGIDATAVFTRTCAGSLACDAQLGQQRDDAVAEIGRVAAGEPENDLLGAIREAARTLPPSSGPRTLVVADPGLSTAGGLRFQDPGVLASEPADVTAFLAATGQLPDLHGIAVVFTGLGDTGGGQPRPSGAVRADLTAMWTAIATQAGAASVRVDGVPFTGRPRPGLPRVTVVPMPEAPRFDGTSAILPDTTVGFRPDTAQLRDPVGARALLVPLAERIRGSARPVTLVGTTASAGPPDALARLSLQRAEAIKALLVGLGVPAEQIRTRGDGYVADPPDTGPDGGLLPGPAAQNRRVVIEFQ